MSGFPTPFPKRQNNMAIIRNNIHLSVLWLSKVANHLFWVSVSLTPSVTCHSEYFCFYWMCFILEALNGSQAGCNTEVSPFWTSSELFTLRYFDAEGNLGLESNWQCSYLLWQARNAVCWVECEEEKERGCGWKVNPTGFSKTNNCQQWDLQLHDTVPQCAISKHSSNISFRHDCMI